MVIQARGSIKCICVQIGLVSSSSVKSNQRGVFFSWCVSKLLAQARILLSTQEQIKNVNTDQSPFTQTQAYNVYLICQSASAAVVAVDVITRDVNPGILIPHSKLHFHNLEKLIFFSFFHSHFAKNVHEIWRFI